MKNMKKLTAMALIAAAMMTGCGRAKPAETTVPQPTTEATTEAATEPTTQPTEAPVLYYNPLNGETLEEPLTNRVFAFSIGNTRESLPHYGISRADIVFESFVNGLTTRRFAMFSDVASVESIGGSRSMRMQFTDLTEGYDAVALYAGGSGQVIGDLKESGIDGIVSEQWGADFYYRDKDRMRKGYSYEHCLFDRGDEVAAYAEEQGIRVTQDADKDYGLLFTENAAPADGEDAEFIKVSMKLSNRVKDTVLIYDRDLGAYTMSQYGLKMMDGFYNVPETYKNVFVLFVENINNGIYHVAQTVGDGEGYFACDGKLVPIQWHRQSNDAPFTFTLTDGTRLEQGIGSSYISLAPLGSEAVWSAETPEDFEDKMPRMPEVQPTTRPTEATEAMATEAPAEATETAPEAPAEAETTAHAQNKNQ